MQSLEERRKELNNKVDAVLVRELLKLNPFGGYAIGNNKKRGQLTRQQAIDTLLRYEGYKLTQ